PEQATPAIHRSVESLWITCGLTVDILGYVVPQLGITWGQQPQIHTKPQVKDHAAAVDKIRGKNPRRSLHSVSPTTRRSDGAGATRGEEKNSADAGSYLQHRPLSLDR